MIIKRIDPLSIAKIAGLLYSIIGLVLGVLVAVVMFFVQLANASKPDAGALAIFSGVFGILVALIFCPILYGALGFLIWLIAAWLYNTLARAVGGVRIELESITAAADSRPQIETPFNPLSQRPDFPAQ